MPPWMPCCSGFWKAAVAVAPDTPPVALVSVFRSVMVVAVEAEQR